MTELWACGARAFPGGCLGPFDWTAGGDNTLDRGNTVTIMDSVEHHAAEDLADAGRGWPQIQRVGVMAFGGFEGGESDLAEPLIVVGAERAIAVDPEEGASISINGLQATSPAFARLVA